MSHDPIIDEVRAIRDSIARDHNYDIDSIFEMLREREARSTRPHVTLPPRPAGKYEVNRPAGASQPTDQTNDASRGH